MTETRTTFEPCRFVGVTLHQANETAQLQFAKVSGDVLLVTIPARQLVNVIAAIDRKLAKAPWLDARASKKA